jgi:papain like cysteine protease AvrRpt2
MRKILVAISVASSVSVAACCNPPANIGSQAVTLNGQQTSMWCWAASGQMTMNFLRPASAVQQCDEANKRFGRTDCCNSPTPAACVNGGWPEYTKYSFKADTTSDAALTWNQITSQIYCAKKPFAFAWHWNNGGGHMMVATGYVTVGGVQYVSVNNPWPPSSASSAGGVQEIYTYDKYVGGQGQDHSHWNDYYNIAYTGQ